MIIFVTMAILMLNIRSVLSFLINIVSKNKVSPIDVSCIADNAGGDERFTTEVTGETMKLRAQLGAGR